MCYYQNLQIFSKKPGKNFLVKNIFPINNTCIIVVSNARLSALVSLVSDGLQMEYCSEREREAFGERLKSAIASFTVDFLPHMKEEEEVREVGGS